MKKLLTLLAVCSFGVVASSSVVACGSEKSESKADLSSIITNTEIDGNKFNTEEDVLAQIIDLNKDSGVSTADVKIEEFKPASEGKEGSAELHANADSKFVGKVDIKITAKDKIGLDSKIKITEVDGNKFNTEEDVLAQIIDLNKDSGVSTADVNIKEFKPASESKEGSAELHANADSKFVGKVDIKITVKKIALESKIKTTEVDGNKFNEEKYVLAQIIALNKDSGVTEADVEIKNFIPASAPSEGKEGSAELHAKSDSKFVGKVNIKITAKTKVALDSKIKITEVEGNKINTEADVLAQIIALNKDSGVSTADVEIKNFKPASEGKEGSAELQAKSTSNFTGKVNIKITAKTKVA